MPITSPAVKLSNEEYRDANLEYSKKLEVLYCKVGGFLSVVPDFSMYAFSLIESSLRKNMTYSGIVSVFNEKGSVSIKDPSFVSSLTDVSTNIKVALAQIDSYADIDASVNKVHQQQVMSQVAQVRFTYRFLYLTNRSHPDWDIASESRNTIKQIGDAVDTIFDLDADLLQIALSDLQCCSDSDEYLDKYPEYKKHHGLLNATIQIAQKYRVSIPLIAEVAPQLNKVTIQINEILQGMIDLNRPAAKAFVYREWGASRPINSDALKIADSALFESCVRYSHHNGTLSTYLATWVKNHVQIEFKFACPVKIPDGAFSKRALLLKFRETFIADKGMEPSIDDYQTSFPTMRIATISALSTGHSSINIDLWHLSLMEAPDDSINIISAEETFIQESSIELVNTAISDLHKSLSSQESKLFTMRYIDNCKRAEILKEFQFSSYTYNTRIKSLELKLRSLLSANDITPAVFEN